MNKPIPAGISKIVTMADKSLRLQVDTQELDSDLMTEVFKEYGKFGYFFFGEKMDKSPDLIDLPDVKKDKSEKTPGQRLRAVLFVYWKQIQKEVDFEIFYKGEMEKLIQLYKNKLV